MRQREESSASTACSTRYIKRSTEEIRRAMGEKDWCVSVFKDNAGVMRFNEDWNLVFKVETHNSPSALDPYGGALTGHRGRQPGSFRDRQRRQAHLQRGYVLLCSPRLFQAPAPSPSPSQTNL